MISNQSTSKQQPISGIWTILEIVSTVLILGAMIASAVFAQNDNSADFLPIIKAFGSTPLSSVEILSLSIGNKAISIGIVLLFSIICLSNIIRLGFSENEKVGLSVIIAVLSSILLIFFFVMTVYLSVEAKKHYSSFYFDNSVTFGSGYTLLFVTTIVLYIVIAFKPSAKTTNQPQTEQPTNDDKEIENTEITPLVNNDEQITDSVVEQEPMSNIEDEEIPIEEVRDINQEPSENNNSYKLFLYIATAIVAVAGLYVAWLYVSSDKDWGFEIEWAFWKSTTLWPILSVLGFFLQFIDWQHTSFDEGWIIKDPRGRKKFVRNDDVLSVMYGNCLVPLIAHLLIIPCAYGAVLYYFIMLPVALLNTLLPYLAALLCIVIIIFFYLGAKNFESKPQTKSFIYLLITTAFCLLLTWLLSLPTKDDFSLGKSDTTSYVSSDSSEANSYISNEEPDFGPDEPAYAEGETEEQQESSDSDTSVDDNNAEENQEPQVEESSSEPVVEETPAEEKPVVQPTVNKRPATQVIKSDLLSARLSNVDYNNGRLEVTIVVRTPMVRRQLTLKGSSARDENNQYVSVSDVEIAGISKERGRDYYVITDNDTAYFTVIIPQMPSSGSLNSVRVDVSMSGSSQWVVVKNISW